MPATLERPRALPGHWYAGFPTHAYAARVDNPAPPPPPDPWCPHRLAQKPSTATSRAVSTSARPPACAGRAAAASAGSWDSFRLFPSEHASSDAGGCPTRGAAAAARRRGRGGRR
ncbi:hypothetical protein PVAP13_6KG279906 [Panicum virgatum]|uniref:Uncharacterized protein n=1 Tax=Panicum virgatum TaxID=38727 RepID=A0A8T0RGE0_PANVG|nr:hypothetical protein PVAP13_6KG279906 [Panicum virgatum]